MTDRPDAAGPGAGEAALSDGRDERAPGGAGDFPSVSPERWRAQVEADLAGASFEKRLVTRTPEGVAVRPLYTPRDWPADDGTSGFPGLPPYRRGRRAAFPGGSGWATRQEVAAPTPGASSQLIQEDLVRGADEVAIRFDRAVELGLDPDDDGAAHLVGSGGVAFAALPDLTRLLENVDLSRIAVFLDAGGGALPVAAAFLAHARHAGVKLASIRGGLGVDPLGALARTGCLPGDLEHAVAGMIDLAAWCRANTPGVRAVTVSTLAHHDAGASAVDELAIATATGTWYLRRLADAGLGVDDAAAQMIFVFALGRDLFMEIAKLRAARVLWSKVVAASGGDPDAQAMILHARTSWRTRTVRDPWVNLLRTTIQGFAASIGGVDSLSTCPFDEAIGHSDDLARRLAWNTQVILREESHLGRVTDPAGGSWYVESLTEELARRAWDRFREIEGAGGMATAVTSGAMASELATRAGERRAAVSRRKDPITGISEYPNVGEKPLDREAPDLDAVRGEAIARVETQRNRTEPHTALGEVARLAGATDREPGALTEAAVNAMTRGATLGALRAALTAGAPPVTIAPLPRRRDAAPFEELRDAADDHLAASGTRPRVFVAMLGPVAGYKPRLDFVTHFFEAGGFEVIAPATTPDGLVDPEATAAAFAGSGSGVAVICGRDDSYPAAVPQLASLLREHGARAIVLAGRADPEEDAWRKAGVDRFIHLGCDVVETLRDILVALGVIR